MVAENAVRSTPSESEGRIGLLGVFASPAIESAFRQRNVRDELWLCCFLVAAAMVRAALLLAVDYQHFGLGPVFWPLLAGRLVLLLISGGVFVALRRAASPIAVDRLFFGWCILLSALAVFALASRPPDNTKLLLMSFAVILVIYCVTPLPLARQAIVTLTYSAAGLYIAQRADGTTLMTVGVAYVLANVFGAITSWRLNRRRREAYLGDLRETELRTGLEKAMAEIKTLRGLLCICAWCKRIRDEMESWHAVETFVQHRTHAAFTHGICPDCLRSQLGDTARGEENVRPLTACRS